MILSLHIYVGDRISILCDGVIAEVGTAREITECQKPEVLDLIAPKFETRRNGGTIN